LGMGMLSIGGSYTAPAKIVPVSSTQLAVYAALPWNTNTPGGYWSSTFHGMGANVCLSFTAEFPIV
jgi:hypothetical protein